MYCFLASCYDVSGNRIEVETVNSSNQVTITGTSYDTVSGNMWADVGSSGQVQTRYLNGAATDQLIVRIGATGLTAWYLTDDQGSVGDLMDDTGTIQDHVTYDAFGNILSESNPIYGDRIKYDGREFDSVLGLYYNRARMYDAATGRWMSQDPLGFSSGDANLYRYVANSPTNATDPSGEKTVLDSGRLDAAMVKMSRTETLWLQTLKATLQSKLESRGVDKNAEKLPPGELEAQGSSNRLVQDYVLEYGAEGFARVKRAMQQGYDITIGSFWGLDSWDIDETSRTIYVSSHAVSWFTPRSTGSQVQRLDVALADRFAPSAFISRVLDVLDLSRVQFAYILKHPEVFDDAIVASAETLSKENSDFKDYLSATIRYLGEQKVRQTAIEQGTAISLPYAFAMLGAFGKNLKKEANALKTLEQTGEDLVEAAGDIADVAPRTGLTNTTRLTANELATGQRLEGQLGRTLTESPHVGAEFVDELGLTYDAIGTPASSQNWNVAQFITSIDKHLLKSNNFTVIDLTGFTAEQIAAVNAHLAALTPVQLARIINMGF